MQSTPSGVGDACEATLTVNVKGKPANRPGFDIKAVLESCFQAVGKGINNAFTNCDSFGEGTTDSEGTTTFPLQLQSGSTVVRVIGQKGSNGALAGKTPSMSPGDSDTVSAHQVK